MHAYDPHNGTAKGPVGRDNPCSPGTGRLSADHVNNNALQWAGRHVFGKKNLFQPVRTVLWKIRVSRTSPQAPTETCRRMCCRLLRNIQEAGPETRVHSPDRSIWIIIGPRIRQQDLFRDNSTVPIADPGKRMDESECRTGQDELRPGNVQCMQDFWRTDWPETFRKRSDQR